MPKLKLEVTVESLLDIQSLELPILSKIITITIYSSGFVLARVQKRVSQSPIPTNDASRNFNIKKTAQPV
jgi:hypothetical protein